MGKRRVYGEALGGGGRHEAAILRDEGGIAKRRLGAGQGIGSAGVIAKGEGASELDGIVASERVDSAEIGGTMDDRGSDGNDMILGTRVLKPIESDGIIATLSSQHTTAHQLLEGGRKLGAGDIGERHNISRTTVANRSHPCVTGRTLQIARDEGAGINEISPRHRMLNAR